MANNDIESHIVSGETGGSMSTHSVASPQLDAEHLLALAIERAGGLTDFGLELLFKVFPQARVVLTHRDPAQTIPSLASFAHTLLQLQPA